MYFELRANDQLAMEMAYWDAQITGLDPEAMDSLTFNIGTGSIEKVTRLREKHKLELIHESDSEQTGYRRN